MVNPVIEELSHEALDTSGVRLLINPTGKFVVGGPMGDAGLTGRKIIVDTYGGWARHGRWGLSGKDPSKVDRSAAYAMRWVAKNVVAAGLAERVEVQVAYAIGKAAPVGLFVETFGSETVDPARIERRQSRQYSTCGLGRSFATSTCCARSTPRLPPAGHFGRDDLDLPWERLDKVDDPQEFRLGARIAEKIARSELDPAIFRLWIAYCGLLSDELVERPLELRGDDLHAALLLQRSQWRQDGL